MPDDNDDGKPNGGDASGKPQDKTNKRKRGNEDEEEPDKDPARKKGKRSFKAQGQMV